MATSLEQLKKFTVVVADTGDFGGSLMYLMKQLIIMFNNVGTCLRSRFIC